MPSIVRRTALQLLALFTLAFAFALPVSAQETDLSGEWVFTVESPNGTGSRDVTLVQDGETITGTISSSMATGEITGTFKEGRLTFVALLAMGSGDFEVRYEAVYEDGQLAEGYIDFGDYGEGTFIGVRKPEGGAPN